jgi:nucleotide-binding universal stress UspA family protein
MVGPVVVGIDGTATALRAVEWAVDEAKLRGTGLLIVHAAPYATDGPGKQRASALLARAYTVARHHDPSVEAHTDLVVGSAHTGLVTAAKGAALLVIGMIGERSGEVVLGSVAFEVAGAAEVPVTVVRRGHGEVGNDLPVVVGIEDVADDAAALRVAFADAQRHGSRLIVLHSGPRSGAPTADLSGLDAWRAEHPDVAVEVRIVHGPPAEEILHAAHGARMVVVAARGRGTAARALVGSTSRALLRHCACPVTVVRRDPVLTATAQATDPHDRSQLW